LTVRRHLGQPPLRLFVRPYFEGFQNVVLKAARKSERVIRLIGIRIGYFHLWAGTHPKFKTALEHAVKRLRNRTDALILDLRDGFGGADPTFLDPFFASPSGTRAEYPKPLVLLINEGVRSGKEWITYHLKKRSRAILVGEKTAGAFLAGQPFSVTPGDYLLYLAVSNPALPEVTEPIEGVGISPDEAVPFERRYAASEDPQLARALEIALKSFE